MENELALKCKALREKWGMTQAEMALFLGCSQSTISLIENGYKAKASVAVARLLFVHRIVFA